MNLDLKKIRQKEIEEEQTLLEQNDAFYSLSPGLTAGLSNFNRTAMYNYAYQYAFNYNPAYMDATPYGGDCANFVSQIIRSGGGNFDTTGNYQWYYYNSGNRSTSWAGANSLYIYLINNDYIGPQGKLASTSERQYLMLTGDPIFIDFDFDGKINHSTVITSYQAGYSAGTKVAAHTTNAFNKPISAYGGSHKYVRLIGYMK